MSEIAIFIGNKNYSSWPLRGWLAIKRCGIEFSVRYAGHERETDPQFKCRVG